MDFSKSLKLGKGQSLFSQPFNLQDDEGEDTEDDRKMDVQEDSLEEDDDQ
jgi:hypothetical protein